MNEDDVREAWADRSGEFSPTYYAHHGPDRRSRAVRDVVDAAVDHDAAILELGCSVGRHLAHLRDAGYTDLTGIEVNGDAFEVMAETSPDLAAAGTFHHDAIEAVLPDVTDGRFDVVFSVETLQHIHPDATWVFEDVARVTDDLLVTVENEGGVSAGDVDGGSANDDGDSTGGAGDSTDADGVTPSADADAAVNYVTEDVPLYYRDWGRIFTDLGLEQTNATTGDRDTLRAFRRARDAGRR